jgi:hypothetical protein
VLLLTIQVACLPFVRQTLLLLLLLLLLLRLPPLSLSAASHHSILSLLRTLSAVPRCPYLSWDSAASYCSIAISTRTRYPLQKLILCHFASSSFSFRLVRFVSRSEPSLIRSLFVIPQSFVGRPSIHQSSPRSLLFSKIYSPFSAHF